MPVDRPQVIRPLEILPSHLQNGLPAISVPPVSNNASANTLPPAVGAPDQPDQTVASATAAAQQLQDQSELTRFNLNNQLASNEQEAVLTGRSQRAINTLTNIQRFLASGLGSSPARHVLQAVEQRLRDLSPPEASFVLENLSEREWQRLGSGVRSEYSARKQQQLFEFVASNAGTRELTQLFAGLGVNADTVTRLVRAVEQAAPIEVKAEFAEAVSAHPNTERIKREMLLDLAQMGLDLIGIVDPSGAVDAGNAIGYALRAKFGNALLTGLGIVPLLGDLAKAGKLPQFVRLVENVVTLGRVDVRFAQEAATAAEPLRKLLESVPTNALSTEVRTAVEGLRRTVDEAGTAARNSQVTTSAATTLALPQTVTGAAALARQTGAMLRVEGMAEAATGLTSDVSTANSTVAAPVAANSASNSADVDFLAEQIGQQSGANPGGLYRGSDGVKRYVKFYSHPSQAFGEALTNQIYRDLKHEAPEGQIFTAPDGRIGFASRFIENTSEFHPSSRALANQFLDGFAADVLTANWDVLGRNLDNLRVAEGQVVRVDNGSGFLYRGLQGRKPAALLDKITEFNNFFDRDINEQYALLARNAGYNNPQQLGQRVADQVDGIVRLRDESGGWENYVKRAQPEWSGRDRERVVQMLEKRTDLLLRESMRMSSITVSPVAAARAVEVAPATLQTSMRLTPDVFISTHRSTLEDRAQMREHLIGLFGEREYNKMVGSVTNISARNQRLAQIPVEDLVALRLYTSEKDVTLTPEDYAALSPGFLRSSAYQNTTRMAFFQIANSTLRAGRPELSVRYEPFVRCLMSALNQLPSHQGVVYRGSQLPLESIRSFRRGQIISENALLSTSANRQIAEGHFINAFFEIESLSGKNISAVSHQRGEKEVIFLPETQFEILDVNIPDGRTVGIRMRELPRIN